MSLFRARGLLSLHAHPSGGHLVSHRAHHLQTQRSRAAAGLGDPCRQFPHDPLTSNTVRTTRCVAARRARRSRQSRACCREKYRRCSLSAGTAWQEGRARRGIFRVDGGMAVWASVESRVRRARRMDQLRHRGTGASALNPGAEGRFGAVVQLEEQWRLAQAA